MALLIPAAVNVSAAPFVAEGARAVIVDSNEAELGAVASSIGAASISIAMR